MPDVTLYRITLFETCVSHERNYSWCESLCELKNWRAKQIAAIKKGLRAPPRGEKVLGIEKVILRDVTIVEALNGDFEEYMVEQVVRHYSPHTTRKKIGGGDA